MPNDDILPLVRDEGFIALLARHLDRGDNGELANKYAAFAKQLESKRFVVPIAGVQGSGKSTALNAIAFDTRVLPVDVDETTCVPVEISWSPEPDGMAIICYADGREESVPATENALQAVVHNGENPGNSKHVDRVVLHSDHPVFRNGLVLVDLPGTGSLTSANMETTERYLSEAVGAIFMLRTVPPLTRSESIFVGLQWARLRTAYFIQNRWSDETFEEAEAGREHNVNVLRDLAVRSRIPLYGDPTVHVANMDAALNARFSGNRGHLDASGLSAFIERLADESADWGCRVRRMVVAAVEEDCRRARALVCDQLESLRADADARLRKVEEDARRFDAYVGKVDAKFEAIRSSCGAFIAEVSGKLDEWAARKRGDLRNSMRAKLRAGITDGPRLERALRDEQGVAAEDVFEMVEMEVLSFRDSLERTLEGLDAWGGCVPGERVTISREEATKWENLVPVIVSPTAGLGGMWLGAKIGGMIGSGFGPAGAIVGGIVGSVLAGLAGLWVGQKSRDLVVEQRAKAVEGEVFAAIDKFIDATRQDLLRVVSGYCAKVEADLAEWRATQASAFERQRQDMEDAETLSQEEKGRRIAAMLNDMEMIDDFSAKVCEAANA